MTGTLTRLRAVIRADDEHPPRRLWLDLTAGQWATAVSAASAVFGALWWLVGDPLGAVLVEAAVFASVGVPVLAVWLVDRVRRQDRRLDRQDSWIGRVDGELGTLHGDVRDCCSVRRNEVLDGQRLDGWRPPWAGAPGQRQVDDRSAG